MRRLMLTMIVLSVFTAFIFLTSTSTTQIDTIKRDVVGYTKRQADVELGTSYQGMSDKMTLYFTDNKSMVPYVDVLEFYDFLLPAINTGQKFDIYVKDNTLVFEHDVKDLKQRVSLNYINKTITIEDLMFLEDFSSVFNYNTNSLEYKIENVTQGEALQIDLKQYDINIEEKEGKYFMPLYLANFLLSGYEINVTYALDNTRPLIFVQSQYAYISQGLPEEISELKTSIELPQLQELANSTSSFLEFINDHFHPLKTNHQKAHPHKGIEYFGGGNEQYQEAFNKYINAYGDLHTFIIAPSYVNRLFESQTQVFTERKVLNQYYYDQAYCDYNKASNNNLITHEIDGTIYIELIRFDADVSKALEDTIYKYRKKDKIYIDIRCNSGGVVNEIRAIHDIVSNEPMKLLTEDVIGGRRIWTYPNKQVKHNIKSIYLVVSGYTYSAANTITSVLKGNEQVKIVGQHTGGGASTLSVVSLPDGSIITISSPLNIFTNSEYTSIESGVEPDTWIDYTMLEHSRDYEQYLKSIIEKVEAQ